MVRGIVILLTIACAAAPVAAATSIETFDAGSNDGGWTYGTGNQSIQPSGGNPGAYLYEPLVDTFAPQPHTTSGPTYTGDYRGRGVTSVGIDLITYDVDFSTGGRPLSVILVQNNDTPGDGSDDWGAYQIGSSNIPAVGEGWRSYDFVIPAQDTSLPPGWSFIQFGPNAPAADWNQVITDVSQLRFFYGDPSLFFIFQQWELGLDNPRITAGRAGSTPGRVPSTLRLARLSPTQVRLTWEPSDCGGAVDYGVYEGLLGDWYHHERVDCLDDGGDLTEKIFTSLGNRYYLVVPLGEDAEGSYGLGRDASGAPVERPPGSPACLAVQELGCS